MHAEPAVSEHRRARRRRMSVGGLLLILAPAVLLLVMAWRYRWIGDDGFINLRVVQQVVAGNGPVFNRGERIEAGTSPLWILILAVADLLLPVRLEWLAVLLGIAGSVAGIALATLGTRKLVFAGRGEMALPVGAIAFVAIPAVWTYSTAGLEGGLSFAWIGASWFALTRRGLARPGDHAPDRPWYVPVLLGLGPLVRPDFLVISVGFLAMLLLLRRAGGWPARMRALAWAAALPVVTEILRMGYYGLLVPNTALAKEASSTYWSQGWHYLADFGETYWLVVPIVLVLGLLVASVLRAPADDRVATIVFMAVPVLIAVVSTVYWARVGGDWMHARVLLPAVLCFMLPAMVVAVGSWRIPLALGVVVWAVWCGVALREPPAGRHGIIDPRWSPVAAAKGHQIITIDDYRDFTKAKSWQEIRDLAESGTSGVLLFHPGTDLDPLPIVAHHGDTASLVLRGLPIGMVSYAVGPDVYIADGYALADPIGSHQELRKRGRPGHEKLVPTEWVVGRFVRRGVPLPLDYVAFGRPPRQLSADEVAAVRAAMGCGDLRDLLAATNDPLTPGRFLENVFDAPRLTSLRIPREPRAAERELCGTEESRATSSPSPRP